MALDKQVNLYSVDTGHFYSNREAYLHNLNCSYRKERNYLINKTAFFDDVMQEYGYTKRDLNCIKKGNFMTMDTYIPGTAGLLHEYFYWHNLVRHKRKGAQKSKERLLTLLSNKTNQNIQTDGRNHIRTLRPQALHDTNIISVFESSLTRILAIQEDELTDALIVVQVYYFELFKDLSYFGFTYGGEKYRYYTSSAGQIRKKKTVFIKESLWTQYEKTIMCGLTIEKINQLGGNNVNKHLAYMALTNSATDLWEDFDIDRTIVIDDFETEVFGTIDFIDDSDYSITRKDSYIPVPHTDGAGMVLPSLLSKNAMFRAPWIKGLLGVFDYVRFIKFHELSPLIKDIYGKEHHILEENIQIIFTKSQFKMYKYYDSWEEYKNLYKKYGCTAGLCNMEEDRIKKARINYQMLQTLTDITEEEIHLLCAPSIQRIQNLCESAESMKEALGITPYNTHMTPFQESLKQYPALLNDSYVKDMLREIKNSLLKKYRSGKLEINGKYTFVLPDFYAACEHWFGNADCPKGLLADQEVFCRLMKHQNHLDCLRSPHLYKEHALRDNLAHDSYGERAEQIGEWFTTNAVYTSTHDLISKILQFDVDGDKLLLVSDKEFLSIAQRNMADTVPLYYQMKKAAPVPLNRQEIYKGLNSAFIHGNIGAYSNDIAKIWNSNVFIHGTKAEQREALDCIKLLCMENNFCIDAAKTLYMPKRPDWFKNRVTRFTKQKLPAFFMFAKDKTAEQVAPRNKSFVNRLYAEIPDKAINTRGLELDEIDYRLLMSDSNITCPKEVSSLYSKLNRTYRYKVNMQDARAENMRHVTESIRKEFLLLGHSEEALTDMLVLYLYGNKKRYKELLWFCFGRIILQNLKTNLPVAPSKYIQCTDCQEWLEVPLRSKTNRCQSCQSIHRRALDRQRKQKSDSDRIPDSAYLKNR